MEQAYDPPVNFTWFQRSLDRLTRNRGISLRIAWSPRLIVTRFVDDHGVEHCYAKYPLRAGAFDWWQEGNRYYRNIAGQKVYVAYQKMGEPVPLAVLPGDIAEADMRTVNYAYHLFVIERRVPDGEAKADHEKARRMAFSDVGYDIMGEFPAEGIWDFVGFISSHGHVESPDGTRQRCCEIAARDGVLCEGLYREPNNRDLDAIKAMVQDWERMPMDRRGVVEQYARDSEQAYRRKQNQQLDNILLDVGECERLDIIAHNRSRVVGGLNAPRHRRPY